MPRVKVFAKNKWFTSLCITKRWEILCIRSTVLLLRAIRAGRWCHMMVRMVHMMVTTQLVIMWLYSYGHTGGGRMRASNWLSHQKYFVVRVRVTWPVRHHIRHRIATTFIWSIGQIKSIEIKSDIKRGFDLNVTKNSKSLDEPNFSEEKNKEFLALNK